ncbi:hypothetical protein [Streptomyces sp. N50]|uniref:hypothetical protein n=1 Tax=Streptomyces sp. N50 TaxID=3081765 RepID=UPI002962538E|nr:hypothetical protein [Streptomyces sp. N50]WOX17204.1 hypothetical protein R2B38_48370 [Streptomyces sp. N50]
MMARHLVPHRLLRPSRSRELHMKALDRLVGAGQLGGSDALGEQLTAEDAVVAEVLVGALEHVMGPGVEVQAGEQVAPQIGH